MVKILQIHTEQIKKRANVFCSTRTLGTTTFLRVRKSKSFQMLDFILNHQFHRIKI